MSSNYDQLNLTRRFKTEQGYLQNGFSAMNLTAFKEEMQRLNLEEQIQYSDQKTASSIFEDETMDVEVVPKEATFLARQRNLLKEQLSLYKQ